ncbi:sugar dehydrogenase complex small subunit [Novosphingobium sp.]|uniref:sugar dehydrogenase complex small subunit n=1 Tax=Novosphingobium sp. TaxID=1874826 RepID=UPI003BAD3D93
MTFLHPDLLQTKVATAASRRSVLLGIAVALCAGACSGRGPHGSPMESEPPPAPLFLKLSQDLTGHADLDALTAARLAEAFEIVAPAVHGQFAALARLKGDNPAALLAAAQAKGLDSAVLAIVAAWYTGSLGKEPHTRTVAYREALMQRPVADALYPPTYALGGPGWWTAPPPPVEAEPGAGKSGRAA